jgi:GDP-4-dehydro-6-deoxy-D-mannose reductase
VTRALITGATGFAGSFLAAECVAAGWDVHGTCLPGREQHEGIAGLTIHAVDLLDAAAVDRLIADVQADRVFHLAAQASVAAAWADPAATLSTNLVMTQRVLSAVRQYTPLARVLVVGSSEEYGRVSERDLPITEQHPLQPLDPYGVSKVAVDYLAKQHVLAYGMHIIRVRPFNHIGPRQRRGFVLSDFAAQLALIEAGLAPPILEVGNLRTSRDFTDVRDVARAYRLAVECGQAGAVYNVCSGQAQRIEKLLSLLIEASSAMVEVRVDPAKYRPAENPIMLGSSAALAEATGWRPQIPIDVSLADTLAYWRTRVQSSGTD